MNPSYDFVLFIKIGYNKALMLYLENEMKAGVCIYLEDILAQFH